MDAKASATYNLTVISFNPRARDGREDYRNVTAFNT